MGTAGSQNLSHTANTTTHAATALWHFAQTWFEEFPHYKPADEQLSLWTESYGGRYGPGFVDYFMRQNEAIQNGTISGPGTHYLHLNTLGIINGCIDTAEIMRAYGTFPYHNTYGIDAFNESQYHSVMYELTRDNGIIDRIKECQRLQKKLDPNDHGDVERVNTYCMNASRDGEMATSGVYLAARKYGWFDITHPLADPFPPPYQTGFLNQHWVQKALGVPVNHSFVSEAVAISFSATGDMFRSGLVEDIAYILDHGVRVAMMYGDRDYACNWVGGEAASLKVPWDHQADFENAGYTPLVVSPLQSGGLTRQHGNLSFTRVYQAGHMVPSYQPEAAYKIFMRAITGRDIATGTIDLQDFASSHGIEHTTEGPKDTWRKLNDILPSPPHECYVLAPQSCSKEERQWIQDGTAIVKDWVVVGNNAATDISNVLNTDEQQPLSPDE